MNEFVQLAWFIEPYFHIFKAFAKLIRKFKLQKAGAQGCSFSGPSKSKH